jgi:hypothetical protein
LGKKYSSLKYISSISCVWWHLIFLCHGKQIIQSAL